MKRFLVILSAVALSSLTAHAGVGLHGGINIAKTSNATGTATLSSTEMMLGAFFESQGNIFHFQPEFNYVKKQVANYLSVPLLLKVKAEAPVFRPFLVIGPAIAMKVEGPLANTFDISLDAGAGLEIEVMPAVAVVAQGRYSFGLVNVNAATGADLKTRGLYLLAGLHFTL